MDVHPKIECSVCIQENCAQEVKLLVERVEAVPLLQSLKKSMGYDVHADNSLDREVESWL